MFSYFHSQRTPADPRRLVILKEGYGKNWPKQRKLCFERDSYSCVKCGRKGKLVRRGKRKYWDVHCHHVRKIKFFVGESGHCDYDKANDLSNLITLCENCHPAADGHKKLSGFNFLKS